MIIHIVSGEGCLRYVSSDFGSISMQHANSLEKLTIDSIHSEGTDIECTVNTRWQVSNW